MNSKEALSDLFFLAIGDEKHTKKCKETIEKDLEILEILKTEIFNEHCFDLDAGWYDDSFSLNENQIKVIKEWLDNEQH